MDKLTKKLKQIAEKYPIENFEWGIPLSCPISIPDEYEDGYSKNVFLKENFSRNITNDKSLDSHYWSIQEWGGIGSFKRNEKNDKRINNFLAQLETGHLTQDSFSCISSLSKVASFVNPNKYAIYDSRAIYTLNWLIFNYSTSSKLFPQPIGRSRDLAKYDMQTIFRLTKRQFSYKSHVVAFHEYCELLQNLSLNIFGEDSKPYKAEMLLFMVAPTKIVNEIETSVSLKITSYS